MPELAKGGVIAETGEFFIGGNGNFVVNNGPREPVSPVVINSTLLNYPPIPPVTYDPYRGIPKSVRIGSFDFKVEVSEVGDSQAGGEFGHTNFISQKIRLAPHQTGQCVANTFLHECIHAIHWVYGLFRHGQEEEPSEEEYTNQTANGLCQFFQDNPAAMSWFNQANQRVR